MVKLHGLKELPIDEQVLVLWANKEYIKSKTNLDVLRLDLKIAYLEFQKAKARLEEVKADSKKSLFVYGVGGYSDEQRRREELDEKIEKANEKIKENAKTLAELNKLK